MVEAKTNVAAQFNSRTVKSAGPKKEKRGGRAEP